MKGDIVCRQACVPVVSGPGNKAGKGTVLVPQIQGANNVTGNWHLRASQLLSLQRGCRGCHRNDGCARPSVVRTPCKPQGAQGDGEARPARVRTCHPPQRLHFSSTARTDPHRAPRIRGVSALKAGDAHHRRPGRVRCRPRSLGWRRAATR